MNNVLLITISTMLHMIFTISTYCFYPYLIIIFFEIKVFINCSAQSFTLDYSAKFCSMYLEITWQNFTPLSYLMAYFITLGNKSSIKLCLTLRFQHAFQFLSNAKIAKYGRCVGLIIKK